MAKRKVTVAVMDYCCAAIKMYSIEMRKGWQSDEVESWLNEHTDYKDTQCYFMASEEGIDILYPDVEE